MKNHFKLIAWDIDYEVFRCSKCGYTFQTSIGKQKILSNTITKNK